MNAAGHTEADRLRHHGWGLLLAAVGWMLAPETRDSRAGEDDTPARPLGPEAADLP